jgi:hypothetical protein
MSQSGNIRRFRIIIALVLISSLISLANIKPASADPGKMIWTTVDTPSPLNNIIVSPSEINVIAIASDDRTFYAADIPDLNGTPFSIGRLYKSTDGGVTWQNEFSVQLIAAGALTPIWNVAIAPDDVNFVVAVTDNVGGLVPGGPRQVFISTNGGAIWQNTNFVAAAGEWISCVDISVTYGGTNRDIAIGTRTGFPGAGRVYVMKATGFSSWIDQALPPSDVVALKFSPTYTSDTSLVVVSSGALNTQVHIGLHDTAANTTAWDGGGYPVLLWDAAFAVLGNSPTVLQIITADLELPSDFSGQDFTFRRYYISTDTIANQYGVYRVDDTEVHRINPGTNGRISSIAYFGTYSGGQLMAGEVTGALVLGTVNVWRTSDPIAGTPTWSKSDTYKSPTGGGNTSIPGVFYANAQLAWNNDGTRAYCGTSSACLGIFAVPVGAPNCAAPTWPDGYLNSVALDESAFSVSPHTSAYNSLLNYYNKTKDTDIGNIWNQLSLIDTEMDVLNDVAVLEGPQTGENLAAADYNVLYLFSQNTSILVPSRFNSIWRSTSDILGTTWERVLCVASTDNVSILRVKQTSYTETDRSDVITFANLAPDNTVGYSSNEGQKWTISNLTPVTDLAVAEDTIMYILNNTVIYHYEYTGTNWLYINMVDSQLDAGHTIAVPLENPPNEEGKTADIVIVGEAGPPFGLGRISYVDFSQAVLSPEPPVSSRIPPPVAGDAHVIFDEKFQSNKVIYNAIRDPAGGTGKIYRWTMGKSTAWDELVPPNATFYGLVQQNNVLYGAWAIPLLPIIGTNTAGVDRTLNPLYRVPPPPEWDYLVTGLTIVPAILFTREPSSLKVSSNEYNSLWAIDNQLYNYNANIGRLWEYTDILAKVGPWTTAPASGSLIPVDPRSGRAVEVNFAWRSLGNISVYELQVAKDIDFTNRVLVNENITPVSQLEPEIYLPAGALIPASGSNIGGWSNLESGHTYYWRVRARRAITGEIVRSPWSATMYFTVESGLRTTSPYLTFALFNPVPGAKNIARSPSFSWSGMPGTTEYEFILAKDIELQQVVVKANVPTTSYLYDGKLDYNTNYYWQVRSILPVVSDPSPIGNFTVVAESKPAATEGETTPPTPSWIYWIIAVVAAVVVSMIAFATIKPSYSGTGGGKLFKIEPIAEKPKDSSAIEPIVEKPKLSPILKSMGSIMGKSKNSISKIWGSITTAVKRQHLFRKRPDGESKDSGPGGSQPTGSKE